MKKRIIASILVVVMLVLSLASCGSYSFTSDDLSQYATFEKADFLAELQSIKIEDGDFTTDEDTRLVKIAEKIYSSIASAIITNAKTYEDYKKNEGTIGASDVVYYCYYATDAQGNVYMFQNMKKATLANSDRSLTLGAIDDDNELSVKIAEALKSLELTDGVYTMLTSSDLDNKKVKAGDTIVVSYTREYTVTEGEATTSYKSAAVYEVITLTEGDAISDILLNTDNSVSVGATVSVKDGSSFKNTFTIDEEIDGETRTCTYSSFKIEWLVDNMGTEVTVNHTPYTEKQEVTPDSLYSTTAEKVDLKDVELTYHIFPVYYLNVPETSAVNILKYIYGKNLKTTSLEAFEGDYVYTEEVEGADPVEHTVSELIEAVGKLWSGKFDEGTELEKLLNAVKTAEKNSKEAEDNYEDAEAEVAAAKKALQNAADDKKAEAQKALDKANAALSALEAVVEKSAEKLDAANADYHFALLAAVEAELEKLVLATDGEKTLGEALVEEYEENVRHTLTEAYNEEIITAVQTEVWNLIKKYVKVTSYPQKLVKEYEKHIRNEYEYDFYKGNRPSTSGSTTTESNYSYYKGNYDDYLYEATGAKNYNGDVDAAILAEVHEAIEPLIQVYVVAAALNEDASAALSEYIQADIDAGAYDAYYQDDDSLTDKQNAKAKAKAEKQAEENKKEALENATNFLITDKVFRQYKRSIGSSAYRSLKETYGEINIRASLQFNRLFYYLTSTNIEIDDEDPDFIHSEPVYVEAEDGSLVIDFRTIKYTFESDSEGEPEGEE